jgi:hypothetical protein
MAHNYYFGRAVGMKLQQLNRVAEVEMIDLISRKPVHGRTGRRREEIIDGSTENPITPIAAGKGWAGNVFIGSIGLDLVAALRDQRLEAEQIDYPVRCKHVSPPAA